MNRAGYERTGAISELVERIAQAKVDVVVKATARL
jgi:hypothetical protein